MNALSRYSRTKNWSIALTMSLAMIATAIGAPGVSAQPTPIAESDIVHTISVSGTGIVSETPDTARVSLGVEARNESLKTAQDDVSRRIESVTNTLTGLSVGADDIQTSNYSIYPVPEYDRNGNYEGIEHYEVSVTLDVTARDLDSLGTILDETVGAGVNTIGGISLFVDDTSTAASQARAAAMEDARARADEYANASGVLITGVYSIVETSAPQPKSEEMAMDASLMAESDAAGAESRTVPISPGSSEIRVDVNVIYTIEQGNG